jgi:hypothetical protein
MSTIPEVFAIVEKKQSTLTRTNLQDISNIMAELRRYQRSDKREFERFKKRVKGKGLIVAVEKLLRKIENRNITKNKSEPCDADSLNDIFKETDDTLLIKISIRKDALPSDQGLEKIQSAINQFFQRIQEISKNAMPESTV